MTDALNGMRPKVLNSRPKVLNSLGNHYWKPVRLNVPLSF
jgi:hypothetical protein